MRQAKDAGAGTNGGQKFAGIFCKQNQVSVGRRLFENFEQGISRLLHEGRAGEDVHRTRCIGGEAIDALQHTAHLAHLDQQLGRIGRYDDYIGMGLDEDAGLFLVDLTQFLAGGDRFVYTVGEWQRERDAGAVAADSAKIGRSSLTGCSQAGHGLRQHDGQRIFAGSARAGKNERRRHAFRRDRLAQMADGGYIPGKLIEAHINEPNKFGNFPRRRAMGLPYLAKTSEMRGTQRLARHRSSAQLGNKHHGVLGA